MARTPETLQKALAHHNAGNLQQAEHEYRQILRIDPRHADALHLLGVIGHQRGEPALAVEYIGKAIAVNGANAVYHTNLAAAHLALQKHAEAENSCRRAIRLQPRYAEAHYNLGLALDSQGKSEAAVESYRKAIELKPEIAEAHLNLGNLLLALNKADEAEACFRAAIEVRPTYAQVHYNLGNLFHTRHENDAAIDCYRQAVACDPNYVDAWSNLATACQEARRQDEAIAAFRTALRLNPELTSAALGPGNALVECERLEAAAAAFEQAIAGAPHSEAAYNHLGSTLKNDGQLEAAGDCFQRVMESDPINARARVLAATMLPPILSSVEELDECRQKFTNNVAALIAEGVRLDPETDEMPIQFYLPYQGQNDRDLQSDLARLYPVAAGPPPLKLSYSHWPGSTAARGAHPATAAPRIRVGFISHFFRSHKIGHLMRGLISEISRERFHVTVLSIGDHRDEVAESIRRAADNHTVLPTQLRRARRLIAEQNLELLFYSDIGTDSYTYSLAFHRLAPVQCVAWGHPVTTGIPNVDYFLSSELVEPDDADGHYTENLVRLKGLPTFYYRPAVPPQRRDRGHFGLPADAHLYLCPQSLLKFHPDFDVLLGAILARDPQGCLVLVEGLEPTWTEMLRARFQKSISEAVDRVQFVPRLGRSDFLNLMALCDVILDPLHFGGCNSTYEALGLGIPVVTLPSHLMRGRVTAACYRKMGLADCVAATAADYVKQAIRLGTDAAYREQMKARILALNHVLFEDRETLQEIEDFLQAAVERARRGRAATTGEGAAEESSASRPDSEVAPAPLPVDRFVLESEIQNLNSEIPALPFEFSEPSPPQATVPSSIVDPPSSLPSLPALLRTATCPACGYHVAVPFYDGGEQPLAALAWPPSAADARAMKRLPLDFVRCVDCGHVYNCRFDYAEVPHSEKPNLMFNNGVIWTDHLRTIRGLILQRLPEQPVVVEVSCGDGHLLRAVAERRSSGRYVGFDPSHAIDPGDGLIEVRREPFNPAMHLAELRPDLIISRHVPEHLMNPLAFVQSIAFAVSWENIDTRLLIEVPCIDRVIRLGRTVDFFYEHNSNFTTRSLERLLARCATRVETVARGYNDEVVYGLAHFSRRDVQVQFALEAIGYTERSVRQRQTIRADVDALAASGRRVAVWGGTGKAAAFINQLGLDLKRFPLVVDSDVQKAGTYVPGAGQEILYRDFLIQYPVDVILIATQWRAGDIVDEIERCGIPYQTILLEHAGRLVDYFAGDHPYRKAA
jgi:predicted O-linked N-acetylglucosamine transferase (SPINDLY family)